MNQPENQDQHERTVKFLQEMQRQPEASPPPPPCCNCNCNQGRGCIYRQAVTPLHELEGPPPRDPTFVFLAWVAGIVTVIAILAGVML